MLSEICEELKNYFCRESDKHHGTFKVSGGVLAPSDFLQQGQYFRIVGSVFNDGVHQFPDPSLQDETFEGAVWAMSVPPSLIALTDEIEAYCESDAGKPTAFTSESFAGYSYTRATDGNGAPLSWQKAFASRLNRYRRIRV